MEVGRTLVDQTEDPPLTDVLAGSVAAAREWIAEQYSKAKRRPGVESTPGDVSADSTSGADFDAARGASVLTIYRGEYTYG